MYLYEKSGSLDHEQKIVQNIFREILAKLWFVGGFREFSQQLRGEDQEHIAMDQGFMQALESLPYEEADEHIGINDDP